MIPFDEIDARLKKLEKDRAWLAEASGRKLRSIGDALAPAAPDSKRSPLLQRALSDAIEAEAERQRAASSITLPPAQDRITIECRPSERRDWEVAAQAAGLILDHWTVRTLNEAAAASGKANGTDGR